MELEAEASSCITFGQTSYQKINPNDYYQNYTVSFGQDLSKFQQYNTPFQTFLQKNNINCPQLQSLSNTQTQSNQQSINFSNYQQSAYFQNNSIQQQQVNGINIFSSQQTKNTNQQQFQAPSAQVGINIFAQNNVNQTANNQNGVNIFAQSQNNVNGQNIFNNIPQQNQQAQNIFVKNGMSLNQMANNLFPQIEVNMNKCTPAQEPQEQEEEGDTDYDPTENDESNEEERCEYDPNCEDDGYSSGTSDECSETSELEHDADDQSFNLEEYLRIRDQL